MCILQAPALPPGAQRPWPDGSVAPLALPLPAPPLAPSQGSRRRRLWELDDLAHCPVLGVCLPLGVLRRLADKAAGEQLQTDDYTLHCSAVAVCKQRSPLAEAVQRELDRRFAGALRQAAAARSPEALERWWNEALRGQDIAGPMWATLTHARCTPALARQVHGTVHMLQHQAGMASRVDGQRLVALLDENAVLTRELADAQQRSQRQAAHQARRIERQQADLLRLRAELIGRDTVIAALREDLQALEATVPDLRSREALSRECANLLTRVHELQRQLLQTQQAAERHLRRAEELSEALEQREAPVPAKFTEAEARARLDKVSVLCVGGRTGSVPAYRQLVEGSGGRFLHHDGGEEDNPAQLDATLAAADLVICQSGCISHGAYWRVKDHCKRTGKQCVFVETPSSSRLKRVLLTLVAQ